MLFAFAAEEELSVETYCFPSEASRVRVEKKLTSILVPSDKLEGERNCLTVQMRPHRRELIQNYTLNLDRDMRVTFSSAEIKHEPCLLQVEKIRAIKNQNTNVELSNFPGASQGQRTESAKDVMQIQTIDKFSFTVDQDAIAGNCRYISKDLYEITISARRDPKPIVPPNLPPGSIVVIPTPPPDQKTISVSTTVQLTRGSRIEIGSLVKDLRKKAHDVSNKPEAQIEMLEQKEEEKVFLGFQ
jgi:hypothetical protein